MSMCQQYQPMQFDSTNYFMTSYEYTTDIGHMINEMDVDSSMMQTGQAAQQNIEMKNTVKLGRKCIFRSTILFLISTDKKSVYGNVFIILSQIIAIFLTSHFDFSFFNRNWTPKT